MRQDGSPPGRLTEQDVIDMRTLVREGRITMKDLAEVFGMSRRAIESAIHGDTWSHVPDPVPRLEASTWLQGQKSPLAKLTEADVIEIRKLRDQDFSYAAIAKRFEGRCSLSTIAAICQGKLWKHLPEQRDPPRFGRTRR